MWHVCNVLYVVFYVRISCFVVRGCVSRGGIYMFAIVICLVFLMGTLTI